MARTSDPHSATAQFFINVADNKFLNFRSPDPQGIGYTVFGKVVSGMDVVNKIAKAPRRQPMPPGHRSRLTTFRPTPIVINKATVADAPAAASK